MFDINEFKTKLKDWIQKHPRAEESDFIDYCEDLIPPQHYSKNQWLFEQSLAWFRNYKQSRKEHLLEDDIED